ncbi:MAG: PIN domain-containing protein [Saccharothrix sp.]|jgi:predicted nucleic acid-binding protein|nr:PIN domain-containing protein [Saccharothrix sp.]
MIYLHTSTLVRLARGGDPLRALRRGRRPVVVVSELTRAELAAMVLPEDARRRAQAVLDAVEVLEVAVSDLVRELAESRPEVLDADQAVHLATALVLGTGITAFACDDPVLAAAVAECGLRAVVPPFGSPA